MMRGEQGLGLGGLEKEAEFEYAVWRCLGQEQFSGCYDL